MAYRISTKGTSKTFLFENTLTGYSEPYSKRHILARKNNLGKIEILQNDKGCGNEIIHNHPGEGIAYTDFLNGNNADAVFASADAVLTWFYDETSA